MNNAAWWMVGSTIASVFIGAGSLFLIWRTVNYTRDAAEAARDAVDEAKLATESANAALALTKQANEHADINTQRETRAYISVNPAGVKWTANRKAWIGHVEIQNVGKVPASNVRTLVFADVQPIQDYSLFAQPDATDSIGAIMPGVSVVQGSEQFPRGDDSAFVYVYGSVNYRDGFGNERFTKFCHRYAIVAYEKHRADHDFFGGIDPSIGRQHQWGNNAS